MLIGFGSMAKAIISHNDNIDNRDSDGEPITQPITDLMFDNVQEAFVAVAEHLNYPAVGELLRAIAEEHFPHVNEERVASLDRRLAAALRAKDDYIAQIGRTRDRATKEVEALKTDLSRAASPFISHPAFNRLPEDALKKLNGMVDRIMSDENDIPF